MSRRLMMMMEISEERAAGWTRAVEQPYLSTPQLKRDHVESSMGESADPPLALLCENQRAHPVRKPFAVLFRRGLTNRILYMVRGH